MTGAKTHVEHEISFRVIVKCQQPTKKLATLRPEQSAFGGKSVKWGSEILKLPTALDCQSIYFYILAVYFKTLWEPWWLSNCITLLCRFVFLAWRKRGTEVFSTDYIWSGLLSQTHGGPQVWNCVFPATAR